ncbi:MAG TPA: hypothetical protein PKA06_05175, partial [Gemmatales bacterium]|nr:hypothetical protein [Gemmatales bacterium]
YLENLLSTDGKNLGTKTLRRYSPLEGTQKIGDETVQAGLRSSIRHIVFDRQTSQAVTFSPDGPLLLGELEQARSDVFLPRLSGLLPANPVKQGDFWKPELSAVQELTDLQEITRNDLECILHSVEGDLAVVQFRGQVEGTTPTGSHLQTMQGSYQFQLRERRLKSIRLEVTSTLKSKEGKPAGNITATYELVRKPASSQLEADGLVLEPTEENTLLLVQEPKFGLEMVHSRRWVPRLPTEKNWQIDGPSGSGITIQFENSSAVSSAQDMRKPIETTLIKAVPDLKALADPPGWPSVERLAWQGTQNGKEYVFEYLLWKQKAAGAIIAARYFAPESELARKDVERMIRSLKRE